MGRVIATTVLSLIVSHSVMAGVGKDLENAFQNLGGTTNTTQGSAYEGQAAGYYNAGSLYARSPVHSTQIANISLPSFNAGCAGIDMHFGGFSIIKTAKVRQLAKLIMNNAESYAFNLALETLSPMIATNFKDIRNLIQKVNDANVNSCETGMALVGSIFPKTEGARAAVCRDIGSSTGIFSDYAAARMGCNGSENEKVFEKAVTLGANDLLLKNMNFAWSAIQKNDFLKKDNELAELFMSITGTLIVQSDDGDNVPLKRKLLPSLADNQDLLKTLMHGGEATIYQCDDYAANKCLNPSISKKLKVSKDKSLIAQTEKLIRSIVAKLKADTDELTSDEKGLIEATRIPIMKIMTVQAAMIKDSGVLDVSVYSETIASDVLYKYLESTIDLVESKYALLQIPVDEKEQFQTQLSQARERVRNLKSDNYKHQELTINLINQALAVEAKLATSLQGPVLDAEHWAASL